MPREDIYHECVKNALAKDGWEITDDPLTIEFQDLRLYADLAAEKLFTAERNRRKIVVEIKSFTSPSLISELEKAVGQYNIYRGFLRRLHPEKEIYLAVPQPIYQVFFSRASIQTIVEDQEIKLIVFNSSSEEIVQWIS
ncbi:MAG: fatty-acid synthase [Oscillatoriales cyanobacterium RU_3_3]|nr:fatty-acid synthase [Microcoleus sp. SU_5_6]NJL68664.1 fatty-acid synthase [Microcoleus sp. SM1_3_4]NJM59938.1 fatty-acid synthase [Oscillatoriales cyanobacterium RU_3_3]NJR24947.1 fatty-acid synthase [Richelia sp. CSU_2_1]